MMISEGRNEQLSARTGAVYINIETLLPGDGHSLGQRLEVLASRMLALPNYSSQHEADRARGCASLSSHLGDL